MSYLSLIENKEKVEKESFRFSWKDSLPTQHLLDVISSILAEEYIAIAKQNPAVFIGCAPSLTLPTKGEGTK